MTDQCVIQFFHKRNWAKYSYAQPQQMHTKVFHTVATLKCTMQAKRNAWNAILSVESLGRSFEGAPCTRELNTSGTRTSYCFGAMDRNFGSVFLPSVFHGLAPVNVDVNSWNGELL